LSLPVPRKTIHSPEAQVLTRQLRTTGEAKGLSQQALAEVLGRPQSFVSKIESGERRVDLVELLEVCRALDVALVDFVADFEAKLRR
jgi:transcriptional regulator with XRE-family HTH domain